MQSRELRSWELQTKEKQKGTEKGEAIQTMGGQGAMESIGDPQEAAGGAAGEGETEARETVEAEVLLVMKRRRLMKAGETALAKENVVAEKTGAVGEVAEQGGEKPRSREGSVRPVATRSGDGGEEGQAALPLELVPFEAVLEEKPAARRKQATKERRLQALTAAQDVLCLAPERLGWIEGVREEASASGVGRSEEEVGKGSRPYVPDWPRVIMESNLSSADEKLEWLQNCLPPNVLEGYKELWASSVIGLRVQSALLVRSVCMEEERREM